MPITSLDLVKRTELAQAISQAQSDANATAIETAVNALIALAALALNDDGTPKDGMVNRTAAIANGVVTLAKLATSAEADRGKYVRSNPTTGLMELSKVAHDLDTDTSAIALSGPQGGTAIGTFTFADVPAGTVLVWATVMARRESGANGGTIRLKHGVTVIDDAATHGLDDPSNRWTQFTLFGRLEDFVGGALELVMDFETGEGTSDIRFGVDGEGRFGRKVMIQAGL